MSKRYQIMKIRLEVEGFKNDIKSLRKQLKDMERQLYKVFTSCCNFSFLDLDILTANVD